MRLFGRLYCTLLENLVIVAWICDLYFLHIHKAEPTDGTSKTNIHNAMEKRMKNFFQHDM